MNKRFKIITILSVIALVIFSTVVFTFGVSAKSESELSASITKKVKYANLFNCYGGIHQNAETLNFSSASDLFLGNDGALVGPEGWSGVSGRCSDLVGGMIGSVPSDQPARGQVLQKLGYSGGGTSSRCVWFEYTRNSSDGIGGLSTEIIKTDKVCASVAADGTMSNYEVEHSVGEPYDVIEFNGGQLRASYDDKVNGGVFDMYINGYDNNWNSFVSKYTETLNQMNGRSSFLGANGVTGAYYTPSNCSNSSSAACTEDVSAGSGSYSIANRNTAASIAASNYLGLSNGNFTTAEKVSLYQFYLKNNSSSIVCNPTNTPDPSIAHKVKLVINSRYYENCYAVERETAGTSVHAVDGGFSTTNTIGYQDIIDALNSMTATTDREGIIDPGAAIDAEMGTPVTDNPSDNPGDNSGGETSNGDTDDVCYGSEGTLGLSWIVCPIVTALYDTLDTTYDVVENNFLKIDSPTLLGDKTRDAWGIFQNTANIIFVIFLLVVIFSQLTGIGIDNYGIKKILPRLIICAILVNLSYFIAQLLVDASNVIGVSIKNLFESISTGGNTATGGAVVGEGIGIAGTGVLAGIAIASFVTNPALLLTLLLSLLTGVISVLALLAILVGRQVGVVVAVVIAPLAFVMYIFPNTSKWLKSWGNLFKGLLLLYPLAAALVGASAFVAGIVANAGGGNEWMSLAAMLIRVVPFFFLPTLFRRSLDAVGNLGTRIQGIGRGLSSGLTRRISSTEGYKNLQKTGLERQNRIRAGLDREGNLTRRGARRASRANSRLGRLFGVDGLQASRMARARKAREEGISDTSELGEAIARRELALGGATDRRSYLESQLLDAAAAGRTSDFFAALDQAQKSGMKSSDIAKITRSVFDTATWGGSLSDDGDRGNFLQEFANRYAGTFLKKDAEQKSWAATRGGLDAGASGALSGFASRGGMKVADLKDNEIVDLSAERLSELLNDGVIDRAQAQRIWSSGANMDSVNKLMLGAFARGDINGGNALSKADAEQMVSKSYTGGLHGVSQEQVQALTEATPQDTVIRDVRWKNEYGERRQTNPLVTSYDPNVDQQITFTKDLGNGGTQNLDLIQQWDGSFRDPKTGKIFKEETLRKGGYRRS